MLRGVEGCGVSTYVRHFKAYYDDNAPGSCQVYAPQLKIGRGETSTDISVNFFTKKTLESMVAEVNANYDVVFIVSVPAVSGSGAWLRDNYITDIVEKLSLPKYLFNLDHHARSLARNKDFDKVISLCDKVVCYSLEDSPQGFIRFMSKAGLNPKLVQLYNFYHWPKYLRYLNTDRPAVKKIIHGARAPYWKRAGLLLNMAERLGERGYVCELMGFERSNPAAHQLLVYRHLNYHTLPEQTQPAAAVKPHVLTEIFESLPPEKQNPSEVYMWGPYEHEAGLKRISESAFAMHPRTFEHNRLQYGNAHEFQGLEAGLMSVPIFHRHFLENVGLPSDPEHKLSNYDFLLSIDDDNGKWLKDSGGPQVTNFPELLDKMEDIYYNRYTETRQTLVEFFKTHWGSDVLLPKQLEEILS